MENIKLKTYLIFHYDMNFPCHTTKGGKMCVVFQFCPAESSLNLPITSKHIISFHEEMQDSTSNLS